MDRPSRLELEAAVSSAFSPHAPVNEAKLFAGRLDQVRAVLDTVRARGLHAVIYGDRGVGKTSLANIIQDFLKEAIGISRVNCSGSDDFDSAIRRALGHLQLSLSLATAGFHPQQTTFVQELADRLPSNRKVTPDEAADLLSQLPGLLVLVVDEFDRLDRSQTTPFADFIKALSDRSADATVVLVGVGHSIDALIASHQSVERCLRQILLPRMSDGELAEIVDKGLEEAGFALATPSIREMIVATSQGFPHFTHLIAQNAARAALEDGTRTVISELDFYRGLAKAVDLSEHTYLEAYRKATTGSRDSLWDLVVLACAQAATDEFGYFSSGDLLQGLRKLVGHEVRPQTIAYHLGKLIEKDRGPLLDRTGPERRYRYRFVNPMMRPFIVMKRLSETGREVRPMDFEA